jgi:carbonic anhydrase
MQSPIGLRTDQGSGSTQHTPTFNYPTAAAAGKFYNWGFGPAFQLEKKNDQVTSLPSFSFNETGTSPETVYLVSWHIHVPGEHPIDGKLARAELHLVHVDSAGNPRAVLAFPIEAAVGANSGFVQSIPGLSTTFPGWNNTQETVAGPMAAPSSLITEAAGFTDFWTYKGSLTTPPCSQGLRFFVSRRMLYASTAQVQGLLKVGRFSSRPEQRVWSHSINV